MLLSRINHQLCPAKNLAHCLAESLAGAVSVPGCSMPGRQAHSFPHSAPQATVYAGTSEVAGTPKDDGIQVRYGSNFNDADS